MDYTTDGGQMSLLMDILPQRCFRYSRKMIGKQKSICRPGDEAILAQGKVDWLGFNYYQPTRVQAPDSKFDENGLPCISKPYIWPERKMNVYRGWEIYPKGIYDFGMKIKKECPDLPFFISENGMGVEGEEKYMDENGTVQDDYRIEFVRDHLEWIAKAIEDGANCLGYHYWGCY